MDTESLVEKRGFFIAYNSAKSQEPGTCCTLYLLPCNLVQKDAAPIRARVYCY